MVDADSIGPKVTFGPLDPGFGTGKTPKYQAVQGPDPLAILAVVTRRSRVVTTHPIPPATICRA